MKRAMPLLLLLVVGCARTSGTVEIPAGQLPFAVARASIVTEPPGASQRLTAYFVRRGRLVAVTRRTAESAAPVEAALRLLLGGPTPAERARGLGSELSNAVSLLGVEAVDGTVHVDLSSEFQEPAPPDRVALRVAQVTWTVTAIPGLSEVIFAIDGETLAVAADDGTPLDRPARRSDYAAFAPRV